MGCSLTQGQSADQEIHENEGDQILFLISTETMQEEEEYLEMDYALEIEDCSRYTFSTQPYYGNVSPTHSDDGDGQAEGEGVRQEVSGAASSHDFACVAVGMLVCEVRRRYHDQVSRCSATAEASAEAMENWRVFARRIGREFKQFGPAHVRKKLSAMLLFDPASQLSLVGDGSARAQELLEGKMRFLQELRERNQLFVSPHTATSLPERTSSTAVVSPLCNSNLWFAEHPQDLLLRPLGIVGSERLDADAEDEMLHDRSLVELCSVSFPSITVSQKSGGGVSSSGSSVDSDEGNGCDMHFDLQIPSTESCFLLHYT